MNIYMKKLRNNIIFTCTILVLSMSLGFSWNWPWAGDAADKYKGPTNMGEFGLMRSTAEKNPPIYANAYAKSIKNVDYGIGVQNGLVVPAVYNLGSIPSRLKLDGSELLGYSQPGTAIELFVNGEKQKDVYPLMDKFDKTVVFGSTQVTLKMETKQLPILPSPGMKNKDDAVGYQMGKVFLVTMEVAEVPGGADVGGKAESLEGFSPSMRYSYENKVRALKDKYLKGVDLDSLSEQDLEKIAREMSAERRELGKEFKAATPEFLREKIYKRNLEKYGDKYGPTISYLRNVQGKTWKQIIESSMKPGGEGLEYITYPSYYYGAARKGFCDGTGLCKGEL